MKKYISLILSSLFFIAITTAAIPSTERAALIALYNATDGDNWYENAGWKTAPLHTDGFALPGTEGSWTGVVVENDNVVGLELSGFDMNGVLPDIFDQFPALVNIYFADNNLSGVLPTTLLTHQAAQNIFVEENSFSGTLDGANMPQLLYLNASRNQITGNLPASLFTPNIELIEVANNMLRGELPAGVTSATSLFWLGLQYNALYTNDVTIDAFVSSIEQYGSDWQKYQCAKVYDFTIDSKTETSVTLSWTALDFIPYYGSVSVMRERPQNNDPPEYAEAYYRIDYGTTTGYGTSFYTDDEYINAATISDLTKGTKYYFRIVKVTMPHEGNSLSVESDPEYLIVTTDGISNDLPPLERAALIAFYNATNGDSWTNNSGWKTAPLHTDGFALPGTENTWRGVTVGTIEDSKRVISLGDSGTLAGNNLTGTLPTEIGDLTQITWLGLYNNGITGEIPSSIGNLTQLTGLALDNNQLSGEIPDSIGNLTQLTDISLYWNQLTGAIPTTIGNLTQLRSLQLFHNKLSGAVPAEIGALTQLTMLQLQGNQFSGQLPVEITSLVNLDSGWTDIGYNMLSTTNSAIDVFMSSKDSDWKDTQTIPPTNVTAVRKNDTTITVSWTPIVYSGAGNYTLLYGTTAGIYSQSFDTSNRTESEFDISGLDDNTTYYIAVRSLTPVHSNNQNALVSSLSSEVSAKTALAPPALTAPENTQPYVSINPTFTWNAVTGADSYELQYDTNSEFSASPQTVSMITGATTSLSGLTANTIHYWRVRAVNANGLGTWSNTYSFTTMGRVTLSSPFDGANGVLMTNPVSWLAFTGATTYDLELALDEDFEDGVKFFSGLTVTSRTVSSLSLDYYTKYYWRVRAVNATGSGPWSDAASFTTVIAQVVLTTPADAATSLPINALDVTWEAVNGATSYQLQYSTSPTFTSVSDIIGITGTTRQLFGLTNNTTYYLRVRAVYAHGGGEWSTTRSFTTIIDAPAQVTLNTPVDSATNIEISPTLTWNAADKATTYELDIATNDTFTVDLQQFTGITEVSKAFTGLTNNTTYYWRVRAVNVGGNGDWSSVRSFTTIVANPTQVTLISPNDAAINVSITTTLSWNSVSGATSYELDVATNSGFTTGLQQFTGITETSREMSTLVNNTTYYWRVRAVNVGGDGNWSVTRSFTTVPAVPGAPSIVTPTQNSLIDASGYVSFTWSAINGATHYEYMYAKNTEWVNAQGETIVATNNFVSVRLDPETTYYLRVRAINAGGNGPWSSTRTFTTRHVIPKKIVLQYPLDNYTATDEEYLDIDFFWYNDTAASQYTLQVSRDPDFGVIYDYRNTIGGLATVRLYAGYDYYWRVVGRNAQNQEGEWSDVRTITISKTLVAPSLLARYSPADQGVTMNITYDDDAGRSVYEIYRGETEESMTIIHTLTDSYIWLDTTVEQGKTYYYAVRAGYSDGRRSPTSLWKRVQILTMQIVLTPLPQNVPGALSASITLSSPYTGNYTLVDSLDSAVSHVITANGSTQQNAPGSFNTRARTVIGLHALWTYIDDDDDTYGYANYLILSTRIGSPTRYAFDENYFTAQPGGVNTTMVTRAHAHVTATLRNQTYVYGGHAFVVTPATSGTFTIRVDNPYGESGVLLVRSGTNWRVVDSRSVFEITSAGTYAVYNNTENDYTTIALTRDLTSFPNPFSKKTTIGYKVDSITDVTLEIFNSRQKRVITLVSQRQDSGNYFIEWDGSDYHGNQLPSGVYFCVLTSGGKKTVWKIIRVK